MRGWMRGAAVLAVGCLVLLAGCYETTVSLAPEDQASIERTWVGDYASPEDNEGRIFVVAVRNLDGRRYYVEYRESLEDEAMRFVGWTGMVGGASFAHLRPLTDDGTLSEKHVLLRFDADGTSLRVRHLKPEFFAEQAVETTEQLRRVLEANLDNGAMYGEESRFERVRKG